MEDNVNEAQEQKAESKDVTEPRVEKHDAAIGFLVNLWEGNLGLAITYWVYGVLGGIVWAVGIASIAPKPEDDSTKFIWLCFYGYYFYIYVGIWNAATKYEGHRAWAILAKFITIIVALPVLIQLYKWVTAD